MSAAPGNHTPTAVAGAAGGDRHRALFAAAVAVALVVVAVGIWLLTRGGGTDVEGTAIGEAVSASTSPVTADPAGNGGPGTPLASTTTAPPPTAAATANTAPLIDVSLLSSVLITENDLGGIALPLDDTTYTSGQDADHPLTDYSYCNRPLDRSQAGGSAKRVLTTNPLATDGIVASTATVFASADAASAVIDQMVANAKACTTYDVSGALPATVTIASAERTGQGARIVEQVDTVGSSAEIRVIVDQVGDLITILEVTPVTADPAGLERLLTTRAAGLPR